MRKLMVATVAVLGVSLAYATAEAKDTAKTPTTQATPQTKPQSNQGPTDAEIDEAHKMNQEYDAQKTAEKAKTKGPTDEEKTKANSTATPPKP